MERSMRLRPIVAALAAILAGFALAAASAAPALAGGGPHWTPPPGCGSGC